MTVLFLGSLSPETLTAIGRSLHEVLWAPIQTHVTAVTFLPGLRRPRILALDLETTPSMMSLEAGVRAAVAHQYVARDNRPFRPHLTVARLKDPGQTQLHALKDSLQHTVGQLVNSTRLNLYESITHSAGAEYHVLDSYDLHQR